AVKHGTIGKIGVLIGAVGLQAKAFMAHGGGAEPGAGAEAGGGVEGGAVEDDVRLGVAGVTADKGLDIGLQHRPTPPPPPASPPKTPAARRRPHGALWC